MALTPDRLKEIVMRGAVAQFQQMQKDLEVRYANILALEDTGIGRGALAAMSHEISQHIVGHMERMLIMSGELDRVVNKLL